MNLFSLTFSCSVSFCLLQKYESVILTLYPNYLQKCKTYEIACKCINHTIKTEDCK